MGRSAASPIAVAWKALTGRVEDSPDHCGNATGEQPRLKDLPHSFRLLLEDNQTIGRSDLQECCYKEHVTHVRQEYDWDCGIACLIMALGFLAKDVRAPRTIEHCWLQDAIGTQSTWTIDLVAILDHVKSAREEFKLAPFDCLFSSKQLALNPDLEAMGYYSQSFAHDASRVQQLYNKLVAQSFQWMLQQEDLTLDIVLYCVQQDNCLAILLVDNTILQSKVKGLGRVEKSSPFVGHYVLLLRVVGNSKVVMHDPGRPRPITVPAEVLREAWQAPGTDSDVIFLARK